MSVTGPAAPCSCPVCAAVPKHLSIVTNYRGSIVDIILEPKCTCLVGATDMPLSSWTRICNEHLGRALRDLRIETVAQVGRIVEIAVETALDNGAPCDVCGYNGPGFYQSDAHKCVELRRRAAEVGK